MSHFLTSAPQSQQLTSHCASLLAQSTIGRASALACRGMRLLGLRHCSTSTPYRWKEVCQAKRWFVQKKRAAKDIPAGVAALSRNPACPSVFKLSLLRQLIVKMTAKVWLLALHGATRAAAFTRTLIENSNLTQRLVILRAHFGVWASSTQSAAYCRKLAAEWQMRRERRGLQQGVTLTPTALRPPSLCVLHFVSCLVKTAAPLVNGRVVAIFHCIGI
jgi:hypothetical protein